MAAPMWRGVVGEYMNGMSDNSASDIVKELEEKNVTLLEVVESIGSSLTSAEASVRARAVRLLADIIQGLQSQALAQKEVDLLVNYMVEKVKDHHSIQPHALNGILTLSAGSDLTDEAVVAICRAMFGEVYTQSLSQADRRNVYQILLNLLQNNSKVVAGLGGEFVHGFIQAMDMEKDPRNLVLAFQCVRSICEHMSLGVFVEEMFEVFSCYFPVDFAPPPDDVFGITREDLVIGLQNCMSASAKFAPFCLPLLLEKITSDLNSAKLDAFNALIACCDVYGASGLEEFLGSLFTAIKREVFSSGDQTVEDCALNALTAIVRTLSSTVSERGSKSSMDGFLDTVLKDCEAPLREPGLRQFAPSARLLQSVAGSSDPAYCKVIHVMMPILIHQFQSSCQESQRLPILNVMENFIKLSQNFSYSSEVAHPLGLYNDQLFELLCEFLSNKSTDLRLQAVTCLAAMLSVGVLDENRHDVIAGHLTTVTLSDADQTVREAGISGLGCLGRVSPALVVSKVLPSIRDRLQAHPDSMEVDGVPTDALSHSDALSTLVSISTHEDIVLQVIPVVVNYFNQIAQDRCSPEREADAVAACRCLGWLLEGHAEKPSVLQRYATETVPELIHSTVLHSLHTGTPSVMQSEAVVTQIAHIVRSLTTKLSRSDSAKLCEGVVEVFVEGNLPPALRGRVEQSSQAFQPLQVSSPWQQTQLICILMAAVTSLHKETILKQEGQIIEQLTDLSLRSNHPFTSTSAAMFLSGMINKTPDGEELVGSIGKLKDRLLTLLTSESIQSEKQRAMTAWLWLTKALVLRGHALAGELVSQLLGWFEDSQMGAEASKGFQVILADSTQVLTAPQHANIRLMYKQRMFMENLPRLVSGFNTTQSDFKKHYLVALSHLVTCVPTQVLLPEVNNLLPLLMHSLLSGDSELQESTLSTLCILLSEVTEAVSKHVDSLIPQLLTISCSAQTMKTRVGALKCLGLLSSLTPHVILPHKKRVIQALEPALDDRKRLVRREAVRTRGEWFLLGAPVKS